ncbi:MAG: hypothetical protein U0Q21_02540 [Dermatophilaceae bacterium]
MIARADLRAAIAAEGPARLVLRSAIVVLGIAAATVTVIAGGTARPTGQTLLLVLTLAAAAVPDSVFPAGVVVAVAVLWGSTVPRPDRPADLVPALVAALLLLGLHLAATALTVWPPGAPIPAAARRRWLGQGLVVAAGTAATTALGGLLLDARLPGTALVSIAALVAIAGGGLAAYVLSTR